MTKLKLVCVTVEIILFLVGFTIAAINYANGKDMSVFHCFILLMLMIHIDNTLNRD